MYGVVGHHTYGQAIQDLRLENFEKLMHPTSPTYPFRVAAVHRISISMA